MDPVVFSVCNHWEVILVQCFLTRVTVCAEDYIIHRSVLHAERRVRILRRRSVRKDRGVLITAHCLVRQKKGVFFFLLQTEYGDLLKGSGVRIFVAVG